MILVNETFRDQTTGIIIVNYIDRAKKFRAKKKLGQNFLVDEYVLQFIIEQADIKPDETIIEIGAGPGFVTELIAQQTNKVIAIEIDPVFADELKAAESKNIQVYQQDILKTNFVELVNQPTKVIANIPYYITTPILLHLLGDIDDLKHQNRQLIQNMIIMVQKEVGNRIAATNQSKNKEYGSLSILVNYHAEVEILKEVKASSFWPRPKVDSVLLRLIPRQQPPVTVLNNKIFKKVIKASFTFRRKNLKNALMMSGFSVNIVKEGLKETNLDETARGETLSIEDFALLSDNIYKLQQRINTECQQ
jgi:16S rRNA (adenine1518-N6/adenine1519-N6)-dimethyltransferase